jgi:hypothetical protein
MDDHSRPLESAGLHSVQLVEIVLAVLASLDSLAVPLIFSFEQLSLSLTQSPAELWPFPAIYFLEIMLVGVATTIFVAANKSPQPSPWSTLPWASAGILLTFVILGAFSIGIYLFPAMLLFLAVGILADRRQKGDWPTHFMVFIFAAMAQAVLVYLMINLVR